MKNSTTIIQSEINKFSYSADEWWNFDGPFKLLHLLNYVRLDYINTMINDLCSNSFKNNSTNLKLLDVGCGGGLVSIPLAKAYPEKYEVTSLDPNSSNVEVIKIQSEKLGLLNIKTIGESLEKLAAKKQYHGYYDVIICMEVVEHIANKELFFKAMLKLLKIGGIIIISTINRTAVSYLKSIVAAEYILNLVPKHTHDWNEFLKPSEIFRFVEYNTPKGLMPNIVDISGISYNPLAKKWSLCNAIDNNYIMTIQIKSKE